MAETEMVERVAWRIAQIVRPDAKRGSDLSGVDIDGEINLYEIARAAIEALREPTFAMRKKCTFEQVERDWPALLDAALSPPSKD